MKGCGNSSVCVISIGIAFTKLRNTVFFQGHREIGSGSSAVSSTRGITVFVTI